MQFRILKLYKYLYTQRSNHNFNFRTTSSSHSWRKWISNFDSVACLKSFWKKFSKTLVLALSYTYWSPNPYVMKLLDEMFEQKHFESQYAHLVLDKIHRSSSSWMHWSDACANNIQLHARHRPWLINISTCSPHNSHLLEFKAWFYCFNVQESLIASNLHFIMFGKVSKTLNHATYWQNAPWMDPNVMLRCLPHNFLYLNLLITGFLFNSHIIKPIFDWTNFQIRCSHQILIPQERAMQPFNCTGNKEMVDSFQDFVMSSYVRLIPKKSWINTKHDVLDDFGEEEEAWGGRKWVSENFLQIMYYNLILN